MTTKRKTSAKRAAAKKRTKPPVSTHTTASSTEAEAINRFIEKADALANSFSPPLGYGWQPSPPSENPPEIPFWDQADNENDANGLGFYLWIKA